MSLIQVDRQALVQHSSEQMFKLVDDIESYPNYLSSCNGATILRREQNMVEAELCLSKSGIEQRFSTRNINSPFERIEMQLLNGPFKSLHGQWTFTEIADAGCRVSFHLEFEMQRSLLSKMIASVVVEASNKLVDVICQRADQLYK